LYESRERLIEAQFLPAIQRADLPQQYVAQHCGFVAALEKPVVAGDRGGQAVGVQDEEGGDRAIFGSRRDWVLLHEFFQRDGKKFGGGRYFVHEWGVHFILQGDVADLSGEYESNSSGRALVHEI
jgi:hypothetical protein